MKLNFDQWYLLVVPTIAIIIARIIHRKKMKAYKEYVDKWRNR